MEETTKKEIKFNPITQEDVDTYLKTAYIFNMSEEDFNKERITVMSIDDEVWGMSKEKLDIGYFDIKKNHWKPLNDKKFDEAIKQYTMVPVGYICKYLADHVPNAKTDAILIIIRRMSDMLMDNSTGNVTASIYNIAPSVYKDILKDDSLIGKCARWQIALTDNYDKVYKDIIRAYNKDGHNDYTRQYTLEKLYYAIKHCTNTSNREIEKLLTNEDKE